MQVHYQNSFNGSGLGIFTLKCISCEKYHQYMLSVLKLRVRHIFTILFARIVAPRYKAVAPADGKPQQLLIQPAVSTQTQFYCVNTSYPMDNC